MKRNYKITLMIGIIFLFINLGFLAAFNTKAAEIPLPENYYFVFNAQKHKNGAEYELRAKEVLLQVTAGDTWDSTKATVEWISSEPGVIELQKTSFGTNFVKVVRKGPGYSTITAVVTQGDYSFSVSCLIKVDLQVDVQKTGLISATTTDNRILVIDEIGKTKQIFLKYYDSQATDNTPVVSGDAISVSSVLWESENENVVTVSEKGLLEAVGSGSSMITITTNTMSSKDKPMSIKLQVVVKPTFDIKFIGADAAEVSEKSADKKDGKTVINVPSSFKIESNAKNAKNLKWKVVDSSTGNSIAAGKTAKMTYDISEMSGNVIFTRVKAGTYEIYAFANDKYSEATNAPYAYMKVVVPFDLSEKSIVMNVGDTYNIIENSNIPSANLFNYSFANNVLNVAEVDANTGIITANSSGNVQLVLTYKPDFNLFDPNTKVEAVKINITVIDGISLSMASASMYTNSTLMLSALVSDPTKDIVWKSSDESIATVEGGIVTSKSKSGKVIITAEQEVNGILKRATCLINVQQSVTSITINPASVTLGIGEFKTFSATVLPKNLSGVTLKWSSSDEKVVKITEQTPLSATVQAMAGGNVVLTAINQDNVVVGYSHITVQQPVTGISLSETAVIVDMATKRLQLRATVYPENASNKDIKWTSTDPSKAKVDANGLVTLVKPGTVTIIATSVDNPAITAMCNITISIPVTSIVLDQTEITMYAGETKKLDYTLLPLNSSNNVVTWTSTDTSVVTVDKNGKVTAKGVGSAVVILRTSDGGHSVYSKITVKKAAAGLKLDKPKLALESGRYHYYIPTITPKDATEITIHWESSDTKVAIVDQMGKVTGKDAGIAIITARTESGAVAYSTVTVTKPVEGLILNFQEKTIYVGEDFELEASVTPSSASNLKVNWKSSNPSVATVSKDGRVKGLQGGTVVITATTQEKGYMASVIVTVKELVSTISLNHENYILGIDKSVMLVATVTTETATNKNVKWISSNEKIATVNSKGKVTGKALGNVTITAIARDGSEVEASADIEVVRPVTSVKLDKGYLSMLVGDTKRIKATVGPKNATYRDLKWTSSDSSVAMVDDEGNVTGLKAGTVTITAEAIDNSGKKAVTIVSVGDRIASTSISVIDKKLVMVPGETKTVQVVMNPVNTTDKYTWSSSNEGVAKVNKSTGKITAVNTGSANITVMTTSGKTAVIEVTVIALNITSIHVEQYTRYMYPLRVEGATGRITWSIDNPQVAEVQNGYVVSKGVGTANITAYVNGRKLTCKITVTRIGG